MLRPDQEIEIRDSPILSSHCHSIQVQYCTVLQKKIPILDAHSNREYRNNLHVCAQVYSQ